jgi:hypothetical protein
MHSINAAPRKEGAGGKGAWGSAKDDFQEAIQEAHEPAHVHKVRGWRRRRRRRLCVGCL